MLPVSRPHTEGWSNVTHASLADGFAATLPHAFLSTDTVTSVALDSTGIDLLPPALDLEPAERYRAVVDTIPHGVWTADAAGFADRLNRRGAEHPDVKPETFRHWLLLVHPDDVEQARSGWVAALRWLLSQVRDAVIVTDVTGVVTHWNEGARAFYRALRAVAPSAPHSNSRAAIDW